MQTPKPWERQPGESSPAWEARKTYLHMGPGRSIERVAQEFTKSVSLLKRWSSTWKWVLTAEQFDAYNDAEMTRQGDESRLVRKRANDERWALRTEQFAEMLWSPFAVAVNDLQKAEATAVASKRPVPYRQKAVLIRDIARAAPLAERAIELTTGQRPDGSSTLTVTSSPGVTPARALATLKAFNEFHDGPEEPS